MRAAARHARAQQAQHANAQGSALAVCQRRTASMYGVSSDARRAHTASRSIPPRCQHLWLPARSRCAAPPPPAAAAAGAAQASPPAWRRSARAPPRRCAAATWPSCRAAAPRARPCRAPPSPQPAPLCVPSARSARAAPPRRPRARCTARAEPCRRATRRCSREDAPGRGHGRPKTLHCRVSPVPCVCWRAGGAVCQPAEPVRHAQERDHHRHVLRPRPRHRGGAVQLRKVARHHGARAVVRIARPAAQRSAPAPAIRAPGARTPCTRVRAPPLRARRGRSAR